METEVNLKKLNDIQLDVLDLNKRLDDIDDTLGDDVGRVSYIRQLTAEFLDFLTTLTGELDSQLEIPDSMDKMDKILGRSQRKRYYLSKFRL